MRRATAFFVNLGLSTLLLLNGCTTVTTHPSIQEPASKVISGEQMETRIRKPGPMMVTRFIGASWEGKLGGLLNLNHPASVKAGLKDRQESIQIYSYLIDHPVHGSYFVDSGISHAVRSDPLGFLGFPLNLFVRTEKLKFSETTAEILERHAKHKSLRGVFLTHMHMDHLLGMPDFSSDIPIFVGAGELATSSFKNRIFRSVIDKLLVGKAPLRELGFRVVSASMGAEVIDYFGDGSFFIVPAPGHTAGSLVFVAATPQGPVLLTGDSCHTSFGWRNGVEPGSYSESQQENAEVLQYLKSLSARHPSMTVYLGHQDLKTDVDGNNNNEAGSSPQ